MPQFSFISGLQIKKVNVVAWLPLDLMWVIGCRKCLGCLFSGHCYFACVFIIYIIFDNPGRQLNLREQFIAERSCSWSNNISCKPTNATNISWEPWCSYKKMKICDVLVFLCLMCYVLPILGEMSSLLDGTLKEGLQIIVLYYQVRKTLFLHPVITF